MNQNPFREIKNAYDYALKNNIDPKNHTTWDDNYKKRQKKLAGILPNIENEIDELKKMYK